MLVQISSGQGPIECQYLVYKLYEQLKLEYDDIELVVAFPFTSKDNTYRSLIFNTNHDVSSILGTVQWIWKSKFRPHHKRKNWYVDVSEIPEIENIDLALERHIQVRTTHSGGPGGQNVNKVETSVTILDVDTGICVTSSEERSQLANKKKALKKLSSILEAMNLDNRAKQKNDAWRKHTQIERGNPVRVYEGDKFKLRMK